MITSNTLNQGELVLAVMVAGVVIIACARMSVKKSDPRHAAGVVPERPDIGECRTSTMLTKPEFMLPKDDDGRLGTETQQLRRKRTRRHSKHGKAWQ